MNNLSLKWTLVFMVPWVYFLARSPGGQQAEVELIRKYLLTEYGEKSDFPRKFIYDKVDLNADGKDELMVGLIGPDFCGTGGCTVLILNADMKQISRFTLVQYPIFVGSDEKADVTRGYKNLYLRTGKVGYVKLVWGGNSYPSNPSIQPKYSESATKGKVKLLNAEDDPAYEF